MLTIIPYDKNICKSLLLLAIKYDKDNGWSNWFSKDVQISKGTTKFLNLAKSDPNHWKKLDDPDKGVFKDSYGIIDEAEIQNLKKWREELSKTNSPLKT